MSAVSWEIEMSARALLVGLSLLAGCGSGERSFEGPRRLGGQEISADVLNRGEFVFVRHCRGCHGQRGEGDGHYASSMQPRPADLTRGQYPRTWGDRPGLPDDAALRRVIVEGIEGTAMIPLDLPEAELEAVVQYLKTLSPVWSQDVQ